MCQVTENSLTVIWVDRVTAVIRIVAATSEYSTYLGRGGKIIFVAAGFAEFISDVTAVAFPDL